MTNPDTYTVSRAVIVLLWVLGLLLIGLGLAGHGPFHGLSAISVQISSWFELTRGVFR